MVAVAVAVATDIPDPPVRSADHCRVAFQLFTVNTTPPSSPVNTMSSTTQLEPYKADFIKQAIDSGVLLFGEFTLKSGR
jgi:hypothetical protein